MAPAFLLVTAPALKQSAESLGAPEGCSPAGHQLVNSRTAGSTVPPSPCPHQGTWPPGMLVKAGWPTTEWCIKQLPAFPRSSLSRGFLPACGLQYGLHLLCPALPPTSPNLPHPLFQHPPCAWLLLSCYLLRSSPTRGRQEPTRRANQRHSKSFLVSLISTCGGGGSDRPAASLSVIHYHQPTSNHKETVHVDLAPAQPWIL